MTWMDIAGVLLFTFVILPLVVSLAANRLERGERER